MADDSRVTKINHFYNGVHNVFVDELQHIIDELHLELVR